MKTLVFITCVTLCSFAFFITGVKGSNPERIQTYSGRDDAIRKALIANNTWGFSYKTIGVLDKDDNGQPKVFPVQIIRLQQRSFFDHDKAVLRPDSIAPIQAVLDVIENFNAHVIVVGHTDSKGEDIYNEHLSLRRAEAVVNYLINQGMAPSLLYQVGAGENQPIATNLNEHGMALNRRVEFFIAKKLEIAKLGVQSIEVDPCDYEYRDKQGNCQNRRVEIAIERADGAIKVEPIQIDTTSPPALEYSTVNPTLMLPRGSKEPTRLVPRGRY